MPSEFTKLHQNQCKNPKFSGRHAPRPLYNGFASSAVMFFNHFCTINISCAKFHYSGHPPPPPFQRLLTPVFFFTSNQNRYRVKIQQQILLSLPNVPGRSHRVIGVLASSERILMFYQLSLYSYKVHNQM